MITNIRFLPRHKSSVERLFLVAIAVLLTGIAVPAQACTDPAGGEGDLTYNSSYKTMMFCDGTAWYGMKGGGGGGSTAWGDLTGVPAGFADGTDDGITAETDPQVGTLTNSKWCTTDGSAVNCTSDAPGGGATFAFHVRRTSTLNQSSWLKVDFNSEMQDADSAFNISTDRFQPSQAGYYSLFFNAASSGCMTTQRIWMAITRNGSGTELSSAMQAGAGYGFASASVDAVTYLNGTTDYIEFFADENCDGTFDANRLNAGGFRIGG